jgi:mannosyltransferase
MFYKHPALETYRYYWRVEPKVQFFCDVDYDVFRFMEDRNQTYGFTINLFDAPESIPSLWPTTQEFLAANPSYLSENNMMAWLTDDQLRPEHTRDANGYSTCHFWSNFEIGDMDFFRGDKYSAYFDYLDKAGGFFYERWGDAPVHSIGLGLLEDASKVHWYVIEPLRHPYTHTDSNQVPRYRIPSHSLLQLPQLAQMLCLHAWKVLRRRAFPRQRGLPTKLLQARRNSLISSLDTSHYTLKQ